MKRLLTTCCTLVFLAFIGLCSAESHLGIEKAGTNVALNDTVTVVYEDVPASINWGTNDFNTASPLGTVVTFKGLSQPPHYGTVSGTTYPTIVYTTNANYYSMNGSTPVDSFQYVVEFKNAGSVIATDSAWIFIDSIKGVNDVPKIFPDTLFLNEGDGYQYIQPLINDIDADRVGLWVHLLAGGGARNGNLSYSSDLYRVGNQRLLFPNHGIPFNINLPLDFAERDMSYMNDTIYRYRPNSTYYGWDSIQYVITEYRPTNLPPVPIMSSDYEFANTADADTGVIRIYIEPKNYIPVAVNDTVILEESKVRTNTGVLLYPQLNDLDHGLVSADAKKVLKVPYLLKNKEEFSNPSLFKTKRVALYHDIPEYDPVSQQMVTRRDSNIVTMIGGRIIYLRSKDFSGVDSVFYPVVEKPYSNSKYPDRLRNDSSELGIIYFVVTPTNELPNAHPDTLEFDLSKVDTLASGKMGQYVDILANDVDVDYLSDDVLDRMSSLTKVSKDSFLSLGETYVVYKKDNITHLDTLRVSRGARQGKALVRNDSVFYEYNPYYANVEIIDSFRYYVLDGSRRASEASVYIKNKPVVAKDYTFSVSEPFVEDLEDSTIASNFAILPSSSTDVILFNSDSTLTSANKSPYAEIRRPETGDLNYFYHKGFETRDSFTYTLSNHISKDDAWLTITNTPCVANNDTLVLNVDPFSMDFEQVPWSEDIRLLTNDIDAENILYVEPFVTDTIETSGLKATLNMDKVSFSMKKEFFFFDSISYVLTDIPVYFASPSFFTKDSAWVYVYDEDGIIDSDGDGISNLLENGISGYQAGEENLDTDGDGVPNYLDTDADNDGLKDNGDCDGDGILNFLDDSPGCDELSVSNAFTPNNDGVNDLFVIEDIKLSATETLDAQIKIYDRWGCLIYENDAYGKDGDWWDGRIGDVPGLHFGDELPEGIYLYYLVYNNTQQQGYIHIQR